MTYEFVDLRERADRFFQTASTLRDVASDALDAVGFQRVQEGDRDFGRRFVVANPPAWESSMLAVFPSRLFQGQPGSEQFRPPSYGDGVLALRTAVFTIQLVADGHPVKSPQGPRGALSSDAQETAAERLYRAAYAVYLGIIQAHDSDQLFPHQFMDTLAGPAIPSGEPKAGLIGYDLNVSVQIL